MTPLPKDDLIVLVRGWVFLVTLVRSGGCRLGSVASMDAIDARYLAQKGLVEDRGGEVTPTELGRLAVQAGGTEIANMQAVQVRAVDIAAVASQSGA